MPNEVPIEKQSRQKASFLQLNALPRPRQQRSLRPSTLLNRATRWNHFPHEELGFKVGDQVVVNLNEEGIWYQGFLAKIRKRGTFNIEFDDGLIETKIEAHLVKHVVPMLEGSKVAYKPKEKKLKEAVVQRVAPTGAVDLVYYSKGVRHEVRHISRSKYTAMAYIDGEST
jgi:hypothetical protein